MTDHEIDLAIMTDERYGIATLRLADAQSAFAPTYRYYFTAGVPGLPALLTAGHGMEIPYVFDLIGGRGGTEVAELARVMGEYWASFVTEGKPSAKGAPEWPEYETGKRETMVLGSRAELVEDPTRERHAAWEGVAFETSRWYILD
jgi:para-nitrobenzyl esterase